VGILQTLSLVLNAGLMVYAHLGLSAVILSSQDPTLTDPGLLNRPALVEERDPPLLDPNPNNDTTAPVAKCDEADVEQYLFNGANSTRPVHSNYCSREYQYGDVTGCLLNTECISECFQETYGYSETCAECFVQIPVCSVMTGCTLFCAQDSFAPECVECNVPCGEEFNTCSGLPNLAPVEDEDPSIEDGDGGDIASNPAVVVEQCNSFDLDAVNTWYNVYNVTFVKSIDDAWNGEARLLAVIIVVFSGLWPCGLNARSQFSCPPSLLTLFFASQQTSKMSSLSSYGISPQPVTLKAQRFSGCLGYRNTLLSMFSLLWVFSLGFNCSSMLVGPRP